MQGLYVEECKQLTRLGMESLDMDTVALGGCPSLNQLTLRCPNLQMLDLQCAPAHQHAVNDVYLTRLVLALWRLPVSMLPHRLPAGRGLCSCDRAA